MQALDQGDNLDNVLSTDLETKEVVDLLFIADYLGMDGAV